ncbi:hypothetical protein BWD42_07385 [Sphingobacterium sp. CZ-UAM]|uniref:TlpA disulfide reductase family protein n=1 Tax=Sphingobacterium sp. CZ-UAM TaxID=1933868 RepID=UPI000986C59E|nr:TlpA disulfide reductase family protein [Sphingobacterium sp. CZ-UAM]OOG19717.1 hypothetical protein BWD42_07385 [Sphingobacterium sp. CZ-UAM]
MKRQLILIILILTHCSYLFSQTDSLERAKVATLRDSLHHTITPEKKLIYYQEMEKTIQEIAPQEKIIKEYYQFQLNRGKSEIAISYVNNNNLAEARNWLLKIEEVDEQKGTANELVDQLLTQQQYDIAKALLFPYLSKLSSTFTDRRTSAKYGEILIRKKDYENALPYLAPQEEDKSVFSLHPYQVPILYATALANTSRKEEAEKAIRAILITGHGSDELKTLAKAFFSEKYGNDSHYLRLMDSIEMDLKTQLQNQMTKVVAPDFTLKDLSGKTVTLHSLRGKVVVLDFWATWCSPCIFSLPAMQKTANAYANDPDVVFLFIHTYPSKDQSPTQIYSEVQNFIADKKYTFPVLMDMRDAKIDNKSKAAVDFKIESIPAKFVIDKKGQICFDNRVKAGTGDLLVTNMKLMIEMARKN